LGGDVTASSNYGEGSTFSLKIPVKVAEINSRTEPSVYKQVIGLASAVKPPQILIVDDIAENRDVLLQHLQHIGFVVAAAPSGEEALKKLETWQPELILLDNIMPGMSGIELARHIKTNPDLKNIPIIFVSASTMEKEQHNAIAAGAVGFISKPINYNKLFDLIANQLDIEYKYTEDDQFKEQPDTPPLCVEDLPKDWLENMLMAARIGDTVKLLQLIKILGDENKEIKTTLEHCVEEFQFQLLVSILEKKKI